MDKINSGPSLSGGLPRKKPKKKKSALENLLSTGLFLIMMGLLITGTGVICWMAFKNPLSRLFLVTGIIMCLSGFTLKMIEICMKIMGVRI